MDDSSSLTTDQIPWELDLYGQGHFTLHLGAPGLNFVWFHTLMKSLKEGRQVMVLCFDLSPEHLEHVFRKNSIDLRLPEYAKLITIKYIVPSAPLETDVEDILSKEEVEKVKVLNTYYRCEHLMWDELKSMNWWNQSSAVSEGSTEIPTKRSLCSLFIDDLHSLQIMSSSGKQAKVFMHQLMNELNSNNTSTEDNIMEMLVCHASQMVPAQSSFGSSQNNDVSPYLSEGEEVDFTEYCKYLANVTVDIKPLTTGYSNDVHGMVEISAIINGRMLKEVRTFKNVNANTLYFSKLTSKVDTL